MYKDLNSNRFDLREKVHVVYSRESRPYTTKKHMSGYDHLKQKKTLVTVVQLSLAKNL